MSLEQISEKNRDLFLDIAKGLAIIIVIAGHEFQGLSPNFDDILGFRLIYSFHMPLFILISGMVFSVTLKRSITEISTSRALFCLYLNRINRSFIRLIIPFASWTVIGYFLNHRTEAQKVWELEPLFSFLIKVIRSPDWSLWFLVCIFYCIVALSFFGFFLSSLRLKLNIKNKCFFDISLLLLSFYIKSIFRRVGITTGEFGVGFFLSYFFYFTLGYTLAGEKIKALIKKPWAYLCIPLFVFLAPFWHRTAPYHLMPFPPKFIAPFLNNNVFGGLVALLGSMVVLLLVEYFSNRPSWLFSKFLARCGVLSLGIYAIHFYFLSYNPPVLAPLIISVIITMIIQKIPVLRVVLLGEPSRAKTVTSNTNPIKRQ
jgi:fucose 4-O-acetylase-like acetyltransferase